MNWRKWLPNVGILVVMAALLPWAVALMNGTLTRDLARATWFVMLLGLIAGWFGALLVDDPVAFLSIGALPLVLGLVQLFVPGRTYLFDIALAWAIAWLFLSGRLWRWWSRNILRRWRPGSPEEGVRLAKVAFYQHLAAGEADEARQIASRVQALGNPRTKPVIEGMDAQLESLSGYLPHVDPDDVFVRVHREWSVFLQSGRWQWPWLRTQDAARATRGTRLEYEFPRLEAMVAATPPEQLPRLAVLVARWALVTTGALNAARQEMLDRLSRGESEPDWVAAVEGEIELSDGEMRASDPDASARRAAWRRKQALYAFLSVVGSSISAADAADAVFDAALATADAAELETLTREIAAFLGPEVAGRVIEVPAGVIDGPAT